MSDDDKHDLLTTKIELRPYTLVVLDRKLTIIFLPRRLSKGSEDAIQRGLDLSPPEMSEMKAMYGKSCMKLLGLYRAYRPDGRRLVHDWKIVISPHSLFYNDDIATFKEKANVGPLYIWTSTMDINASSKLVKDIMQHRSILRAEEIDSGIVKRSSKDAKAMTSNGKRTNTVLSAERAVEYVGDRLQDGSLVSVGIRYAILSDESRTRVYSISPFSSSSTDDDLDGVRLAPNTAMIDESHLMVDSYLPIDNEFFATSPDKLSFSKKNFYFGMLGDTNAVRDNASFSGDDTKSMLFMHPEDMNLNIFIEECWASDFIVRFREDAVFKMDVREEYRNFEVDDDTPIVVYHSKNVKIANSFWSNEQSSKETINSIIHFKPPLKDSEEYYAYWRVQPSIMANIHTSYYSMIAVSGIKGIKHNSIFEHVDRSDTVMRATSILYFVVDNSSPIKKISELRNVISQAGKYLVSEIQESYNKAEDDTVVFSTGGIVVKIKAKGFPKFRAKMTMNMEMTVDQWDVGVRFCSRLIAYLFQSPTFGAHEDGGKAKMTTTDTMSKEDDDEFLKDYFDTIKQDDDEDFNKVDNKVIVKESSNSPDDVATILSDLKAADATLFDYPIVDSQFVKYSTLCHKLRQPVVVTSDEMKEFDPKVKSLSIGSSPQLAKRNRYICPEVWCPKSRKAMSSEEYKDNKCPLPDEIGIPRSYHYIGYQNPSKKQGDKHCMPCCFSKPKNVSNWKCNGQFSEENNGKMTTDEDDMEMDESKYSQYIMSRSSVLLHHRLGLLPYYLERTFGNVPTNRGNRHDGTGNFTKKTSCFVRVGIERNESQPFLSCMIFALDNPAITTVSSLVDVIRDNITPEIFVEIYDGMVCRTFVEIAKRKRSILDEAVEHAKVKHFIFKNPNYAKMYNLVNDMSRLEIKREYLIMESFEHFKAYLQNDSVEKKPDILGDIFNHAAMTKKLNPKMIRFVFADTDDMTISTLKDETITVVKFVLFSTYNRLYELIGHVSHKNAPSYNHHRTASAKTKNALVFAFDFEELSSNIVNIISVKDDDNESAKIDAMEMYTDIHKDDRFVDKIVISYDRAMVGFISKSNEPSKNNMFFNLEHAVRPPFQLLLGQSYVYEDRFNPEVGNVDLALFVSTSANRPVAADTDDRVIKSQYDPSKLSTIDSLKNPLSPLPIDAKTALLCDLIRCTPEEALDMLLTVRSDEYVANDDIEKYNEFDLDAFKNGNEIFDAFVDPYGRIDRSNNTVSVPIPKINSLYDEVIVQRKNNAGIVGDYRQVKYKWRDMLRGFEVLHSDDTLWDIFERASTVLNRKRTLNGESLKAITSAFIANDEEMLQHVALTNAAMETLDLNTIRKRILSGTCPPSFCEICVLSRLVDVRIIILRRKLNGDVDDDGFMCMNSNPNTDPTTNVIIFEHRVDKLKNIDIFLPIIHDRTHIANKLDKFSHVFVTLMNERCSCKSCWDDRCLLVIEELAQKKKTHMDSLLRDTISKMYRKIRVKNRDDNRRYLSKTG